MVFFSKQNGLVEMAEQEFIEMLKIGYDMFSLAAQPISKKEINGDVDDLKMMDKKINKMHRDVRKKLFEHLSISGGKDLFPSLVLLSVIDDSERIGDYTTNIDGILTDHPTLKVDELETEFEIIVNETDKAFSATINTFLEQDEKTAMALVRAYKKQASRCDRLLKKLLNAPGKIHNDYVAMALLVRFLKRISAHLKNIASAVVNPYHRIGYKVKKQS